VNLFADMLIKLGILKEKIHRYLEQHAASNQSRFS
jgi:hypothetical protein